jgi:hypothetical protein
LETPLDLRSNRPRQTPEALLHQLPFRLRERRQRGEAAAAVGASFPAWPTLFSGQAAAAVLDLRVQDAQLRAHGAGLSPETPFC